MAYEDITHIGVCSLTGSRVSSLSSLNSAVDKTLGVSGSTQSSGPASSVAGLGPVCKDYEENAMAAEKSWTGKGKPEWRSRLHGMPSFSAVWHISGLVCFYSYIPVLRPVSIDWYGVRNGRGNY